MLTNNVFTEVRQPDDIDLVKNITDILIANNHPNPTGWIHNPIIQEAVSAAPKLQRFLINRFWRMKLGMCADNTTRERFCLVDTGDYLEYLKLFKVAIVPCILRNQLLF